MSVHQKEELTNFASNIECIEYEYEQCDYMSSSAFTFRNNMNYLKIGLGHGVCDASRDTYWIVNINEYELCEEADLINNDWIKYEDEDKDMIEECRKLLGFKTFDGLEILSVMIYGSL